MFLPIFRVLKPIAVPIPDSFQLVQDNGREKGPWGPPGLQKAPREKLQLGDVIAVELSQVSEQLCENTRGAC